MEMEKSVLDVFQRGLVRGSASLPFDPEKEYFYVEHPIQGWRVYLRSACFIHKKPKEECEIDFSQFVVVKRTGQPANEKAWEPPKGQSEGKDGMKHKKDSILKILTENIKREVGEEARIEHLQGLRHSGLVFQGREKDYPPNHFFQYHIFQAMIHQNEYQRATEELDWYRAHPAAFARLRRDKREKDALDWFSPSEHKLMGRWSPKIVAMYLNKFA
jgi:hypothetical protein